MDSQVLQYALKRRGNINFSTLSTSSDRSVWWRRLANAGVVKIFA